MIHQWIGTFVTKPELKNFLWGYNSPFTKYVAFYVRIYWRCKFVCYIIQESWKLMLYLSRLNGYTATVVKDVYCPWLTRTALTVTVCIGLLSLV